MLILILYGYFSPRVLSHSLQSRSDDKMIGLQPMNRLPEEFGRIWKNLLHFPMPTNCLCWSGCFHLFSRFIITWCHPMTEPGGSTSLTSPTLKSPINVLWHLDPEATTGKAQLVKMVKDCAGAGSCSCHWPGRANLAKGPWSLLICSLGQDHKSFPLSGLLEKTSQAEKESFSLRWDGKVLRGRMPGPNTGPTTCQDLFL